MTITSTCFAPCEKAPRYVQQLVSHWSHKMAATWADGHAEFPFDDTTSVTMDTDDRGIAIKVTAQSAEREAEMRPVIEKHLDRFAFREAPLQFNWD